MCTAANKVSSYAQTSLAPRASDTAALWSNYLSGGGPFSGPGLVRRKLPGVFGPEGEGKSRQKGIERCGERLAPGMGLPGRLAPATEADEILNRSVLV